MNNELKSIISNLRNTLGGQPWYGKPVFALIGNVDPAKANIKPNNKEHSLNELLYHMINWAEFALNAVAGDKPVDHFDSNDWREINPTTDTWENGVEQLKAIHEQLVAQLHTKTDELLEEIPAGRKYNFRFLLNGLIQHNIYHAGQIAFLTKYLV